MVPENEGPRSSDGTVEPETLIVGRLPAFAPWGKYNLRSHTRCIWNSLDMESSALFNADGNIWHAMNDDDVNNLNHEILAPNGPVRAETSEEWKSVLFD